MTFDIDAINSDPMGFIKKNKKTDVIDLLMKADDAFFNNDDNGVVLKDDIYDLIKDFVRTKDPKNKYFKRIGADVKNKVVLPYYMGSLNKIKDSEEEIAKYQVKYPGNQYRISDKLDGVSCMLVYTPGKIKMYTRGNGTEGQDISHLLSYVNDIIPPFYGDDIKIFGLDNTEIAVRGELIISKVNWDELGTMGKQGANPRNTVSGAINSDILNKDILSRIDFVAYSLVHPKLNDGIDKVKNLGFNTVYSVGARFMTLANLSKVLEKRREDSDYVIDGIVIEDISRYHESEKGKNPDHAFAFKSIHTLEQVEVIVSKVEWNVSKDMYMKPIVMFNEIDLDGVKIKQATGFNGQYITKNVVGPGSRIIIIRSGNVIPHIHSVLSPSANGSPSMPGVEGVNYKWNDTHVDIIMINKDGDKNRDFDIKNILYFMKTANIENMGPGNIAKIYDAGFDDIKKIANITKVDLLTVDGFKEKTATNIINALAEIKNIDCLLLMDASNIMGRGFSYKKIKLITDTYPSILLHDKKNRKITAELTASDLMNVDGIAEISANLFIANLPKFYEFYDNLGIKCKGVQSVASPNGVDTTNKPSSIQNTNILGKSFVFTGFRDKDLEAYITRMGGFVKTSVSKNTDYVVVADLNDNSGKVDKARSLGVPIILRDNRVFDEPTPSPRRMTPPSSPSPEPKKDAVKAVKAAKAAKECPDGKILNPITNRCINIPKEPKKKDANTAKAAKDVKEPKKNEAKAAKECPDGKILNPITNRCINIPKQPKKKDATPIPSPRHSSPRHSPIPSPRKSSQHSQQHSPQHSHHHSSSSSIYLPSMSSNETPPSIFKDVPSGEDRFTLITFQNQFRPAVGSKGIKVLFADLDHTLITPKGKHVFPKSLDDWKWKNDAVVPKLKDMYDKGYEIVIVSNQKKMTKHEVNTKATMIYKDLKLPFVFISGHSDMYYRKPQLGLWEMLIEYIFKDAKNIDMSSSVFIGDSEADLYFARNTNVKFIHTDAFFLGIQDAKFAKIENAEHPLTKWVSKTSHNLPPLRSSTKHLVVMVGSPASGKSYYSQELETKGFVRINKDTMKTDKAIETAFNKGIKEGQNIVIDNTNPTKEARAKWITAAKKASYHVTIVWMNFPISVVEYLDNYRIAKYKNQDYHVPIVAMRVYYKKLEEPTQQECDTLLEIKTINADDMLSVWV
jgi:DNA 3'-phosphatase